ncbi:hypothetical protein [Nocardia sp. MDA0666]|uniref:toxin-antitoxin system YwqK family antitoxin n=1 Tax=Nocardia sp. MDA0666 TaxID=2135448 RepID=UPI00130504EC
MQINADDDRLTEGPFGEVFYDGVPFTGEIVTTGADGRILASTLYRDGKEDGPESEWYPSGTPKVQGSFQHGEPIGHWKEWYPNGELAQHTYFESPGTVTWRKRRPTIWQNEVLREIRAHHRDSPDASATDESPS